MEKLFIFSTFVKFRVEKCEVLVKEVSENNLVSDIKLDMPKFDTALLHSNWNNLRRKYLSQIPTDRHKRVELWTKGISRTPFPLRDIRKNPRSTYARGLQAMAQFVLKIERLSHIMGPTPILEMARAYGLHSRLWLLLEIVSKNMLAFIKRNAVFVKSLENNN